MNPNKRQVQINREIMRYRLLELAYHGGTLGVPREFALSSLAPLFQQLSEERILEAARYLRDKGLIKLANENAIWRMIRTTNLIDYYEDPSAEINGITRPQY